MTKRQDDIIYIILLCAGIAVITAGTVHLLEAKKYTIKTETKFDSNCWSEAYLRATDNTIDKAGEHRNLLGKITVEHQPTAGEAKILKWKMSFDGSKIKTPKLRVYVITDETVDKQYLYQNFNPKQVTYTFHFQQHTDQGRCLS